MGDGWLDANTFTSGAKCLRIPWAGTPQSIAAMGRVAASALIAFIVATASGDHHRICRFGRDRLSRGRVNARLNSKTPCLIHGVRSPVLGGGLSLASSWKMLASESGTSPPWPVEKLNPVARAGSG